MVRNAGIRPSTVHELALIPLLTMPVTVTAPPQFSRKLVLSGPFRRAASWLRDSSAENCSLRRTTTKEGAKSGGSGAGLPALRAWARLAVSASSCDCCRSRLRPAIFRPLQPPLLTVKEKPPSRGWGGLVQARVRRAGRCDGLSDGRHHPYPGSRRPSCLRSFPSFPSSRRIPTPWSFRASCWSS